MNLETRVFENVFEMLPSERNPTPLVRINALNPLEFRLKEHPVRREIKKNPFAANFRIAPLRRPRQSRLVQKILGREILCKLCHQ